MEDKYQERPKRSRSARVPPQRGQVKARIFKELVQKVKNVVSVVGLSKKGNGNGGSASTSTYTSEGHSDSLP
jgi:hypothetical protein